MVHSLLTRSLRTHPVVCIPLFPRVAPAWSCGIGHDRHEGQVDLALPLVVSHTEHEEIVQLWPESHGRGRGGCEIGAGKGWMGRYSKSGGFRTIDEGDVGDWVPQKNNLTLLGNHPVCRVADRIPGLMGHLVAHIGDES